jgi:hypothetical protein
MMNYKHELLVMARFFVLFLIIFLIIEFILEECYNFIRHLSAVCFYTVLFMIIRSIMNWARTRREDKEGED